MQTSQASRFRTLYWLIPVALVALVVVVFFAQWLRQLAPVQSFLVTYPGHVDLPEGAPIGLPAWLGWQHFFNVFFIVLIIQSGLKYRRTKRPEGFWTSKRTKPGERPRKISIDLWFHLSMDLLWFINGVLFVILLVLTGQWMRIVPTSWEVFPNALSVMLQYASLNWPTENGWVNYNSLQVLFYFVTVFVAAPLAALTGVRMSPIWPEQRKRLSKLVPIELARAIHYPVMFYFVVFIIVHVTLVFATGALRNLNHMYAANDGDGWQGLIIFAVSLVVIVAASVAARPVILRPIAGIFGKVSR